ncbi:MAG: hypothetical protein K6E54_07345 [Bacteroidaceae bacterium]|nr:hypothetical protein [Bacteroidaceae bacterium]
MASFWTKKDDEQKLDEKTANPFAELIGHGNMNFPDPNNKKEEPEEKTDYEKHCQQELDNMLENMEDRCFGDMAEGQFVRSH